MIGRALLRLPVRPRPLRSQCQHDRTVRTTSVLVVRTYATPGRPKRVVGEPSRPVKRTVKTKAAQPADGESAAEKQVAAKKRTAKTMNIRETLSREQKAATKEQAAAMKAAVKAAAKERSEKEKAAQQKRKESAKVKAEQRRIAELKKAALKPPPFFAGSGFNAFTADKMSEALKGATIGNAKETLTIASQRLSGKWKSLSAADIEHYNHVANQKKEARRAEYKRWVESHSVEQIHAANSARHSLRRKFRSVKGKKQTWRPIEDERQVKRPVSAYIQFSVNRNASGDFRNISIGDRSKLIAKEWKELSEDEKKKYAAISQQDRERYSHEFIETYGYEPSEARFERGARLAA